MKLITYTKRGFMKALKMVSLMDIKLRWLRLLLQLYSKDAPKLRQSCAKVALLPRVLNNPRAEDIDIDIEKIKKKTGLRVS